MIDTVVNVIEEVNSLLSIVDDEGVSTNLTIISESIGIVEISGQGAPGQDGIQGIKGDKGDVGVSNVPGIQGIQGLTGSKGDKGDQGIQGVKGDKGDIGIQGETGTTGLQGIQGYIGLTGQQGIQGEAGSQGIIGLTGIQGEIGAKGDTGNDGIQGLQGVKGDTGAQGAKGETGLQGIIGLTGTQGLKGDIGLQGIQGISSDTGMQSTGILSGGMLSINTDTTKFNLSSGVGCIMNNYSDSTIPVKTTVEWIDMIGVSDPYIGTVTTTYIAINSTGSLVFKDDDFTLEERKDLIVIGWNDHPDNLKLDDSRSQPTWTSDVVGQMTDFFASFGVFNIEGNEFYPNTGLSIRKTAGKTFDTGSNYQISRKTPNIYTSQAEVISSINYYYRNADWVNDSASVSVIDPNNYDTGLGLGVVPVGKWTVQLILFYANTDAIDIQYGQTVYDTLAEAKSALNNPVEINPFNSEDTFRAWLLIKQGTTNLTNNTQAIFIQAGKLGLISVAAGGGSGGEINTSSNQGLVGTALTLPKNGVDLPFKSIEGTNQIVVSDDISNKSIKIELSPSNISHKNIGDIGTNTHAQIDDYISKSASKNLAIAYSIALS